MNGVTINGNRLTELNLKFEFESIKKFPSKIYKRN
jgi:hypothetical protein